MDQYELIRTAKRRYGKSIREIQRETGHHRKTIRKALAGVKPAYRRRKPPANPVMDAVAPIAAKWLEQDRTAPPKQRHTARRVWKRLREEHGFEGAESTVRRWVREWWAERGMGRVEAVIPLDPEAAREAEVDWGTAWVEIERRGAEKGTRLFSASPAILELLDEVPHHETFHQADMIIEGLANLSPRRLHPLLVDCRSVKVKRLFLWFAERHNHAWLKKLDRTRIDLGRGPARQGHSSRGGLRRHDPASSCSG